METNSIKSQLSANSLNRLREELPLGSYLTIAERFKISKSTVSRILSGKIENLEVVEYAVLLVKQKRDKIDALNQEISNF